MTGQDLGKARIGDEKKIHTFLHVREDILQLYGFFSKDDLNELECLVHALFVITGYDGHHVSHKADVGIDQQTVVGAGLRVSLAGLRITASILRHILPSEDLSLIHISQ